MADHGLALPEELKSQTLAPIIRDSAESLKSDLQGQYPKVTGTLANRVVIEEKSPLRVKVRTKAPHAHLVFLGVSTAAQGKGVGSAMLKAQLAPVDAQHLPAYLETSSQRNVDLYARHGFEITGEFDKPGLHMWTMTRPAR